MAMLMVGLLSDHLVGWGFETVEEEVNIVLKQKKKKKTISKNSK